MAKRKYTRKVKAESAPVVITPEKKANNEPFVTGDNKIVARLYYEHEISPCAISGGKIYSDDPDEPVLDPMKYTFAQTVDEVEKLLK